MNTPPLDATSTTGSVVIHNCGSSQISSPDNSEALDSKKYVSVLNINNVDEKDDKQKAIILKIRNAVKSEQNSSGSEFLSPPTSARRRSSVMFNDYVILHAPAEEQSNKNVAMAEKTTQTADASVWQVSFIEGVR